MPDGYETSRIGTAGAEGWHAAEIAITSDQVEFVCLPFAKPTELTVHAGGRELKLTGNDLNSGMTLHECRNTACDCHAPAPTSGPARMATLTTREMRTIAAILDGLNKARVTNTRMGIPTTPDEFTARFPNGFTAVLRWTPGVQSPDATRQRTLERCARHRDGYQLDLAAPVDPTKAVQLQDPQPVKRGPGRVEITLGGRPENITRYLDGQPQQDRRGKA